MKRSTLWLSALVILGFLTLPAKTFAQTQCGINLDVQYALMSMWNKDVRTSNVYYEEVFDLDKLLFGSALEETRAPVPITTGRSFSLRGGLYFRPCGVSRWGFGVKGWLFNASAPAVDTVTTPENLAGIRGIRIRNEFVFPGKNSLSPDGLSPILRSVVNKTYPRVLDIVAFRTLTLDRSGSGISFIGGMRVLDFQDYLVEEQYQRMLFANYFAPDSTEQTPTPLHLDINYLIQDQGISTLQAYGPVIGISGTLRESTRFALSTSFTQTIVFGTVNHEGFSLLLVDQLVSKGSTKDRAIEPIGRLALDAEQYSFFEKEKVAIPMTEFEIGTSLALGRKIALGAGGFISIMLDTPTIPRLSASDTSWTTSTETLVFAGLTIGGQYRLRVF